MKNKIIKMFWRNVFFNAILNLEENLEEIKIENY